VITITLQGKRSDLIQEISDKKQFRFDGTVMSIYDDRNSAKETLKIFEENGWIEVKTHGVFEVTEEGREKAQSEDNRDKEESLDSFTG
jgi:hypothetical protein